MSGKRYRQRRRFMRTWGGHPDAGRLWANHGGHQGLQRDWCVQYLDTTVKLRQAGLLSDWSLDVGATFPPDLQQALLGGPLYSTPMGYADPLNRDAAVDRHLLYGGANLQQPGPALRGISSA